MHAVDLASAGATEPAAAVAHDGIRYLVASQFLESPSGTVVVRLGKGTE